MQKEQRDCEVGARPRAAATIAPRPPRAQRRDAVTVVLVDALAQRRRGLSRGLSAHGLDIVGEAGDDIDAVTIVVDLRPDVVVLDLEHFGSSGLDAIQALGIAAPAARILLLAGSGQDQVAAAIVAGASGYLRKSASLAAIARATRATAAGEPLLSPQLAGELLRHVHGPDVRFAARRTVAAATRAAVSAREAEILRRMACGESNAQIGLDLLISENTVRNETASVLAKLQLESRIHGALRHALSGAGRG